MTYEIQDALKTLFNISLVLRYILMCVSLLMHEYVQAEKNCVVDGTVVYDGSIYKGQLCVDGTIQPVHTHSNTDDSKAARNRTENSASEDSEANQQSKGKK